MSRDPLPNRHSIEDAAGLAETPTRSGRVAETLLVGFVVALGLLGVWLVFS